MFVDNSCGLWCSFIAFCCSFTADYVENKGLAGARKRAATDGEEEEEDLDDGSVSLGSKDTPEKMSSKKQPPASAKKPSVDDDKPKKTGDAEVDKLTIVMSGMQLTNNLEWGFNFNCNMPHFWWTYNYEGARYLKVEVLVAVMWHQDIVPVVSESGQYLIVNVKLPDFFLNMGRMFGYYHDAAAGGTTFEENDSIIVEGTKATREIKAKLELSGGVKSMLAIKLPFRVLSNFVDPYHPDGNQTGYGLRSYHHERNPAGGQVKLTVLSVSMQEAKSVRVKASLDHADVPVDQATMNRFA